MKRRVLPGFGLSIGFTLAYLSLVVYSTVRRVRQNGGPQPRTVMERRQRAASGRFVQTIVWSRTAAAAINTVFGLLLAWSLVRYTFPGRDIVDALIDLPFALPTAVAGISLTALYAKNGWIGSLIEPLGLKVAFTPIGVLIALVFIGVPFVVRTVQPVLEDLDTEIEEAAATLGATRAQTFLRVVLPIIAPALMTGFALAFARAVGKWLSDFHRRQHSDGLGNHAAHHHHQTRAV